MGCCCRKPSPRNDFSEGIKNLNSSHRSFMRKKKNYTISVDRKQLFGGHHIIVISDGEHEDISFEITVDSKVNAAKGSERAKAKVAVYNETNRDYLEQKGEVYYSLYQLAETAARILENNQYYHLFNNNCQNFCNKFLGACNLPTYATDTQVAEGVMNVASKAYTWLTSSSQQK